MTHEVDVTVTFLTERHQTAVRVLPGLTAIDIPSVMDIQPALATATATAPAVTPHNLQTALMPATVTELPTVSLSSIHHTTLLMVLPGLQT